MTESLLEEIWSRFANYLEEVYDWGIEASHESADNSWIKKSLSRICKGFNAVTDYCKAQKLTTWQGKAIRIVDSILILEDRNSKPWSPPPLETTKDLQNFYTLRRESNKENWSLDDLIMENIFPMAF